MTGRFCICWIYSPSYFDTSTSFLHTSSVMLIHFLLEFCLPPLFMSAVLAMVSSLDTKTYFQYNPFAYDSLRRTRGSLFLKRNHSAS